MAKVMRVSFKESNPKLKNVGREQNLSLCEFLNKERTLLGITFPICVCTAICLKLNKLMPYRDNTCAALVR